MRGVLPDERVFRTPVEPMLFGFPGWLNTLKKSAVNRTLNFSWIEKFLNSEAS